MMLAPFGNPEWEIWSCSPGTFSAPRHDVFFELHRWENAEWFSEEYKQFLRDFNGPIWMAEEIEEIPNSNALPWKELCNKYGPYFFTSSLAWMLAMAIEAGAEKIALYGVDMAASTEYENQRLGCQFFCSLARKMGIEVGVPPESDLLRPAPLYGICETSHAWIKQRARTIELKTRQTRLQQEVKAKTDELNFLSGALDDQDHQLHSWFGGVDTQGVEFTSPPDIPALGAMMPRKTNGAAEVEMPPPPPKKTRRPRAKA
jgi:hypothetical protein